MPRDVAKTYQNDFAGIYHLIQEAKSKVWQQVNRLLINLYWNIGQNVSEKVKNDGWGKNIVEDLSKYILSQSPSLKGFSARNIWRMKQFYETYCNQTKLSALLTEISWTNHLHILSKTKSQEEREYYLMITVKQRYSERDLARLIDSGT